MMQIICRCPRSREVRKDNGLLHQLQRHYVETVNCGCTIWIYLFKLCRKRIAADKALSEKEKTDCYDFIDSEVCETLRTLEEEMQNEKISILSIFFFGFRGKRKPV